MKVIQTNRIGRQPPLDTGETGFIALRAGATQEIQEHDRKDRDLKMPYPVHNSQLKHPRPLEPWKSILTE